MGERALGEKRVTGGERESERQVDTGKTCRRVSRFNFHVFWWDHAQTRAFFRWWYRAPSCPRRCAERIYARITPSNLRGKTRPKRVYFLVIGPFTISTSAYSISWCSHPPSLWPDFPCAC